MTDRQMIAYAILIACLIGAVLVWHLLRRARRGLPHLRIDLLGREEADKPPRPKP